MTTPTARIETGDTVSFASNRGIQQGVVAKLRLKERKAARRMNTQLSALLGAGRVDYVPESTMVAEIPVVREGKTVLWTVPVRSLTLVKKGGADTQQQARQQAEDFKRQLNNNLAERRHRQFEAAYENNLMSLTEEKDFVTIRFREGKRVKRFLGFVSGSGNVRFCDVDTDDMTRTRTTPAKFCSVPTDEEIKNTPALCQHLPEKRPDVIARTMGNLETDGLYQIKYTNGEFITGSVVVGKTLKAVQDRKWDLECAHRTVRYDRQLQVFWRRTGSFD